ncbi:MAG: formate dehydrogenase accessory sulfurtransferase FdhD [Formosimonas sp.]
MSTVQRISHGQLQAASNDILAVEAAIAIEINGLSHAVMMGTPHDLADFALGFVYNEAIVRRRADVFDVEIDQAEHGFIVRLTIASACFAQLKDKRRTLLGRTGCGLCGVASLAYFQTLTAQSHCAPSRLDFSILDAVLQQFDTLQPLRAQTGATHAAAWVNWQGKIELVREDVGRHNALDKLIGALLNANATPADGFVLVSSRASFEMVQKTAQWGAGCLVAVSAATSRAVKWAEQHHIQLIGFARMGKAVLYTGIDS